MLKNILIFLFGLLIFNSASAQHKKVSDTLAYYLDYSGKLANSYNIYRIMVILPADSSSGKKLYQVNEYNRNGKRMQTGTSTTNTYDALQYEGGVVSYYDTNGARESITNYYNGMLNGIAMFYYPNGKVRAVEKYKLNGQCLLGEYRDSTGNVLAQNGNGNWLNDDLNGNDIETGPVKDSLEDGEWHETFFKTIDYSTTYQKGVITASTDPARQPGADPLFKVMDKVPQFAGDFGAFLARNINYPAAAKEKNIQGKVILSFVVEKDGSLSYIAVIKAPDKTLADEALRVMKTSPPWAPAQRNNQPVRMRYMIPISFSLADGN